MHSKLPKFSELMQIEPSDLLMFTKEQEEELKSRSPKLFLMYFMERALIEIKYKLN